jgi:hypothetical protein
VSSRAWRTLAGVLVAVGFAAAALAWWRSLEARHPVIAVLLAVGFVIAAGIVTLVRMALAEPAAQRLRQAGVAADKALARLLSDYRRRYRRWVLDSRRYVDVKGLATAGDFTPQVDQVYVDVALTRRAPHLVSGDPLSDIPEDAAERLSIGMFLDRRRPVVLAVLGPPGCGKTTLLVHAARHSAGLGRWGGRGVPVLLALRDHAAKVAGSPELSLPDVLRGTLGTVPADEPAGWWERQLRRGKCVVLLDGLDEVAREQDRRAITGWAETQIARYPENHFVVTSRPHGYREVTIGAASVLAIRPFTGEQVRKFVDGWYLATETWATGAASEDERRAVALRARESATDLVDRLRAAPALHDLTVNPLLLTMIANVHRYRGALPGSRADLYREICQVMLSRRVQAKGLAEQMPWPAKESLLTRLAYEMMRRRVRDLSRDQVLDVLRPGLRRMPQGVTGQDFLDDVSFNGLLAERENGQYAFSHLTFQEFLASQHIRENGLTRTLVDAAGDEWWRETTLLYAATANTDPVVRACLDRGTIPALTLAFECADSGHELAPELRQRLSEIQALAFRPDSDKAHRLLVAAVIAARLARQSITISDSARLCAHPVPVSLYWLFVQDTQAPAPDGPCNPLIDPAAPATGIWGGEATAFISWLNAVVSDPAQPQFRLPYRDEVREQANSGALNFKPPGSLASLWVRPGGKFMQPALWVPPGRPDPYTVSMRALQQAIAFDAKWSGLALELIVAAARALASNLRRILISFPASDVIFGLSRFLPNSDFDFDGALGIARALDSALLLARQGTHGRDILLYDSSSGSYDRDSALVLIRDIDRHLTEFPAEGTAVSWALGVDRNRDVVLNYPHNLDATSVILASLGKSLGTAVRDLMGTSAVSRSPEQQLALSLTSMTGMARTKLLPAQLNGILWKRVRKACMPYSSPVQTGSRWNSAVVASRLVKTADGDSGFDEVSIAALRLAAVVLACDSEDPGAKDTFLTLAATTTLMTQRRGSKEAVGESLILARS